MENMKMNKKYKFNVGDYVELKDGSIGYIKRINHFDDFYHMYINLSKGGTNCECNCDGIDFYKYFKRIGKYDFTKSEQQEESKKIEKLEYIKTDTKDIVNKLNEVIDKVNEIGERK